ncbi:uncharacterized protein [Miscanthus floridulus]|uniref:uncharacterized protein n=1 Tax=Miscanthus floridulus TaxID=154761 RepID=UPI003457BDB5
MKIPTDRLFEMNKKIFLVSFLVEREVEKELKSKGTDDGCGYDDNLDNDDEADDLDDDDGVEKPPTTEFQAGESSKMKTSSTKPSANSGWSHLDRIEVADAVDLKDATKTKTNVRWSGGGEVDGGDTEDGTKRSAAS